MLVSRIFRTRIGLVPRNLRLLSNPIRCKTPKLPLRTQNTIKPDVYYSTNVSEDETVSVITFEKICEETLESLTEYFEKIVEENDKLKSADVSYSSGVLTVHLGSKYGTYVINRQSPNRQIWLSSPISGPKRYDFVKEESSWVYKHDGRTLHQLLQEEISKIVSNVDFSECVFSK